MKKQIKDTVAYIFIICIFILGFISVGGVWTNQSDIIEKTLKTGALLSLVVLVVFLITKNNKEELDNPNEIFVPDPFFKFIRKFVVILNMVCLTILAFFGILAIWDLVPEKDVLYKSISSIVIIGVASILIIMTAKNRETNY